MPALGPRGDEQRYGLLYRLHLLEQRLCGVDPQCSCMPPSYRLCPDWLPLICTSTPVKSSTSGASSPLLRNYLGTFFDPIHEGLWELYNGQGHGIRRLNLGPLDRPSFRLPTNSLPPPACILQYDIRGIVCAALNLCGRVARLGL